MKASLAAIAFLALCASAIAEAKVYEPIGAPAAFIAARSYISVGEARGSGVTGSGAVGISDSNNRPVLRGVRPMELELLHDALRRKFPRRVGESLEKANEVIIRNGLRDPRKRAHIKGILAEALYLEGHPTWEYVAKSNAPQVDVFRRVSGGRPVGAQIKTHVSSKPSIYARDMLIDHKADFFLVPDDHVPELRALWRKKVTEANARGAVLEAVAAQKQLDRIGGLGFTSTVLNDSYSRTVRYALRERNAKYVSLGAGLAVSIGPGLWEWWRSGSMQAPTTQQVGHAVSILAGERVTTWSLARIGGGVVQGGLRSNLLTGTAILAIDSAWSLLEYGGTRSFRNPDFYSRLGGGVGGLVVGIAIGNFVMIYATLWTAPIFGGWAPAVGGVLGLLSAAVAGTVGHAGGDFAVRKLLIAVIPELLYKAEDEAVAAARESVLHGLRTIQ